MTTFSSILQKASAFDAGKVSAAAIRLTQDDLAEANRQRMLEGYRSDGSEMPFYSYISQTVYGYPNTRIRLRATGEFQDRIVVSVDRSRGVVKQTSIDYKTDMLVERYGEKIFGTFGVYQQAYVSESLRPAFVSLAKAELGLVSQTKPA